MGKLLTVCGNKSLYVEHAKKLIMHAINYFGIQLNRLRNSSIVSKLREYHSNRGDICTQK